MKLGIIGGAGLLGATTAFYAGSKNILEEIPDAGAAPAIGSNKEWYKSYSADSLYYIAAIGHDLVLYSDHGRDSVLLTSDGEQWYSYAVGGDSEKKPDSRSGAIGLWVGSSNKYFMVREDKRKAGCCKSRPQEKKNCLRAENLSLFERIAQRLLSGKCFLQEQVSYVQYRIGRTGDPAKYGQHRAHLCGDGLPSAPRAAAGV